MLTFLLGAILFVTAVDTYAKEANVYTVQPPYPIKVIVEKQITMDIGSSKDYWRYLSPDYLAAENILPDAIIGDLICYSDGTGEITLLDDFKEIWDYFTPSGQFVLNNDMVTIGSEICDKKLEELYGYHVGESPATWHF